MLRAWVSEAATADLCWSMPVQCLSWSGLFNRLRSSGQGESIGTSKFDAPMLRSLPQKFPETCGRLRPSTVRPALGNNPPAHHCVMGFEVSEISPGGRMKSNRKFSSMLVLAFFMGLSGSAGMAMADPVGSCTATSCCSATMCCNATTCRDCESHPMWCALVRNQLQ